MFKVVPCDPVPTTEKTVILLMFTLISMAWMATALHDVNGAFLNGVFSRAEKMHVKMPKALPWHSGFDVVSLSLKTI